MWAFSFFIWVRNNLIVKRLPENKCFSYIYALIFIIIRQEKVEMFGPSTLCVVLSTPFCMQCMCLVREVSKYLIILKSYTGHLFFLCTTDIPFPVAWRQMLSHCNHMIWGVFHKAVHKVRHEFKYDWSMGAKWDSQSYLLE